MRSSLLPARVPSPGRIIRRELVARGWTQKDLAHSMNCSEQAIRRIVSGQGEVTPEIAQQLARAFGTSPELWLNLAANYRLQRV